MGRRRRRRSRSAGIEDTNIKQNIQQEEESSSITSLLKKINFRALSGQLRDISDNLEKIGEISELMEQVDILVKPKQGGQSGFNLFKILQNGDSLNNLLQVILPALRESPEKKVEPINVETIEKDEE
ncbi:MAG: hypothetical protein ACOX4L_11710 [Bacillota bacterium]|jgi:hypothetical protein